MTFESEDFKNELWQAVAAIESKSQVEAVTVIKPESDPYREAALWAGLTLAWLVNTVYTFLPAEFYYIYIYLETVACFFAAYFLIRFVPALKRRLIPKARMKRQVEVMARAIFQKGGLHHTSAKSAVLIYVSLLEQSVFVLPDRGLENALSPETWQELRAGFQGIFAGSDPAAALLTQLQRCQPVLQAAMPPLPNDINELPDRIEIAL